MGLLKNNIVIAVIALILLSVGGFYYISRGEQDDGALLVSEGAENGVDRELLATLLELKSLKFNDALFESNTFRSLKDFSREIPDEPAGRPNPFAPVGTDRIVAPPAPEASDGLDSTE
jgi:hypothetical protein